MLLFSSTYFCPKTSLRKRQSMILSSLMSSVIFNCSLARRISVSMVSLATQPSTLSERMEKSWIFAAPSALTWR